MNRDIEVLCSPVLASDEIIICHFATGGWINMPVNKVTWFKLALDAVCERRDEKENAVLRAKYNSVVLYGLCIFLILYMFICV